MNRTGQKGGGLLASNPEVFWLHAAVTHPRNPKARLVSAVNVDAITRSECTFWWRRSRVWRADRGATAAESRCWRWGQRSPCCPGLGPHCWRCLLWRRSSRPGQQRCTESDLVVVSEATFTTFEVKKNASQESSSSCWRKTPRHHFDRKTLLSSRHQRRNLMKNLYKCCSFDIKNLEFLCRED